MAQGPRPNKKAANIAYAILGKPINMDNEKTDYERKKKNVEPRMF